MTLHRITFHEQGGYTVTCRVRALVDRPTLLDLAVQKIWVGQATVRPGDEALGLTRALLHSGTSTVISGVAKVSDRGAADLMADYHRRLAAGSTPAYALAAALGTTEDPIPFACFGAGW